MKKMLPIILAGVGLVGLLFVSGKSKAATPTRREITPDEMEADDDLRAVLETVLPSIHEQVDAQGATVSRTVPHNGRVFEIVLDTDGAAQVFEVS